MGYGTRFSGPYADFKKFADYDKLRWLDRPPDPYAFGRDGSREQRCVCGTAS